MTLFAQNMPHEIQVKSAGPPDKDLQRTLGPASTISARWEYSAERLRDVEGNVIDKRDRLYTHDEVDEDMRFWPPGANTNTNNDDEAIEPITVEHIESLDGSDVLYKVVF